MTPIYDEIDVTYELDEEPVQKPTQILPPIELEKLLELCQSQEL